MSFHRFLLKSIREALIHSAASAFSSSLCHGILHIALGYASGLPPLVLRGTAEELDAGFFQSITQPLEETSSLLVNMEQYIEAQ
ncbi:MAG: hypothetical protein ACFN4Y_04120, partial [Centipeda sp. (in: firmicutes)]